MVPIRRIIICKVCGGSGKKECSERVNHHHNIDIVWDEKCRWCGGHGRVVEEVTYRKLREDELKLREREGKDYV